MNNQTWKGEATNSAIPTNSRPFSNKDPNLGSVGRAAFKPNPIKHWRKQLKPYYATKSKQVSFTNVDAPTSTNYITTGEVDCAQSNIQLLKENIHMLNHCYGFRLDENGQYQCIGGSNHIRRSANTNVKRNYHQNYSSYLQSKCKTYDRNLQLGTKIDDVTFNAVNCTNLDGSTCNKNIIYKPNNKVFKTQGAVSASSTTLHKKNIALTNNEASLRSAYGKAPVFKRGYKSGENSTGYEIYYVKGDTSNPNQCNQTFKSCK